jgi:hypothetical protein
MAKTNRGPFTSIEEGASMEQSPADIVREIVTDFAGLTGLADGQAPKRYQMKLWLITTELSTNRKTDNKRN